MKTTATYPTEGKVFELTLDGDAPENQPIEMVKRDGYDNPESWKHTGLTVTGTQTRRFKLVSVGYCSTFDEVKAKLAGQGTTPEGQWREAFKAAYPTPDCNGPIGVADGSWAGPGGRAHFPCVNARGGSDFRCLAYYFNQYWRWLVLVGE